jgi:hypothetical protein
LLKKLVSQAFAFKCNVYRYTPAAVMLPKLGWPTFFEEPVMLLAFVLLGWGGTS